MYQAITKREWFICTCTASCATAPPENAGANDNGFRGGGGGGGREDSQ